MAASKFEKALHISSNATSAAASDDSCSYILNAYARSICSLLRAADVTSSAQRWKAVLPSPSDKNSSETVQIEISL